jgi:hypothetical protein
VVIHKNDTNPETMFSGFGRNVIITRDFTRDYIGGKKTAKRGGFP